jgi:5-enolpyruvylshikimate-3-phosphate synthase
VELQEYPDGIDISGGKVTGARVQSHCDHRCAMSFAVLGLVASDPVLVDEAEYIATSYPGFTDDMRRLGAVMRVAESL